MSSCDYGIQCCWGHPKVLKSGYRPEHQAYRELKMKDVALATSAAPTYFPAAHSELGAMLDGGVWANCPVMVGVTEAISAFRKKPESVHVLNIGTTNTPFSVPDPLKNGGKLHWAKPISSLLMHATRVGVLETARKLGANVMRVDVTVAQNRFDLDDLRGIDDLEHLGREQARANFDAVNETFLQDKVRRPRKK